MSNAEWIQRDLSVLWHPCTQMKDHEWLPLIPIKKGEGVWLEDFSGNRYIDAVSSWWVNIFGHSNPKINAALETQMNQLEHVIFAGFSHQPGIELAEKLVELTPQGLDRVFYADNGSSAVEIALKMSYHYWLNSGKGQKSQFVHLTNSYHGETLGALAVGDVALYKETYEPLLLKPISVKSPDAYNRDAGETPADYAERAFEEMERTLAEHHDTIAAVIVEPLIQCAGTMRMYDPIYLKRLREACDRYQVHLIADEVAVGFGRTGKLFACEHAEITPDYMCLSKALTAGYLPLSAVLTSEHIYQAFYDDYENLTAFLHSHSYTANPLACAVALATLKIFEEDNVIENNLSLAACMSESAQRFTDHPNVGDVRQQGMVLAIEMVKDKESKTPFPWQERRGLAVYQHALKNEVLLRPLGNVAYFMPPYVITPEQIDKVLTVAYEGIEIAAQ